MYLYRVNGQLSAIKKNRIVIFNISLCYVHVYERFYDVV